MGLGNLGCARGACAGRWVGSVCCGAWDSPWWVCARCPVSGVVRAVSWVGLWRAAAAVRAGGGGLCRGTRGCARWWACVGLRVSSERGGESAGIAGGVCCVGVCVRSQRRPYVVSCRPGGLEEKLAVF